MWGKGLFLCVRGENARVMGIYLHAAVCKSQLEYMWTLAGLDLIK